MASKTRKTRTIRKNKRRPNKANLRKYMKRIQRNAQIIRQLEEQLEKESQ